MFQRGAEVSTPQPAGLALRLHAEMKVGFPVLNLGSSGTSGWLPQGQLASSACVAALREGPSRPAGNVGAARMEASNSHSSLSV